MVTRTGKIAAILAFGAATAALAHSGVQNAAVKARMDGMSAIGENLKIIGLMAKGETAFDADAARSAAAEIARHASETPALFEAQEEDPKSEALPSFWENFDDFTTKANAMEKVALGLSTSIQAADDLGLAMDALGGTCKACHSQYRQ